eukprot:1350766-Amorphochlora_amoeboformis.AAC.1
MSLINQGSTNPRYEDQVSERHYEDHRLRVEKKFSAAFTLAVEITVLPTIPPLQPDSEPEIDSITTYTAQRESTVNPLSCRSYAWEKSVKTTIRIARGDIDSLLNIVDVRSRCVTSVLPLPELFARFKDVLEERTFLEWLPESFPLSFVINQVD